MIDLTQYFGQVKVDHKDDQELIWCTARKKWLVLTPEEMVRQTVILHLLDIGYSPNHITAEKQIIYNQMRKRYDVAVSDKLGNIHILVECKEPGTSLSEATLRQASVYNLALGGKYLWITNGPDHRIYHIDHKLKSVFPLDQLPLVGNQ